MRLRKTRKLILSGGGGHCESVLDSALRMGLYEDIVILDPNLPVDSNILGCRVVGDDSVLPQLIEYGFSDMFISVGSIKSTNIRHSIYNKTRGLQDNIKNKLNFPNIIDPSAQVSEFSNLGKGIYIGKNCVINAKATVEDFAIINNGVIIEHGCCIGSFSHISVGATVCGDCRIGSDVFVGAGSTIIQGINIPDQSFVQAGSVILKGNGFG